MAKTSDGLDLDDDGLVTVSPVTGWTAFVPFGMAVGLRIEFAPSPDRLETPEGVQLVLLPPQARELAEVLLRKADQATQPPETGAVRN
jgi:hypothetical protein